MIFRPYLLTALAASTTLMACGGSDEQPLPLPQLTAAQAATLSSCTALSGFSFAGTTVTAASTVASGTLNNAGQPVGEHCLVVGRMNDRVSTVDGQTYAIGFQMRLPRDWNGRFLHQGNGGTDGTVAVADGGGSLGSGGLLRNGLQMGFAVLSSDAGHSGAQNPLFGIDPQARLDYGYQAVRSLTPMAKALILAAYNKGPDRSYFAGSSNGGRHAMVAAARLPADYDGFLANSPGFNLPKAAVAQLWGAQQWNKVVTSTGTAPLYDLESAFTQTERRLVANAILGKCDALDGVADGLVQDADACRTAFDLARDVPTCSAARDGTTCLSAAQKTVVADVFAGAKNSAGTALYARWAYDPGLSATGWADWKFRNSVRGGRDPVAVAHIFSVPPVTTALSNTLSYALSFNMDTDAPNIFATNSVHTESAMSLMTPPDPANLDTMRLRGGKMLVIHGSADGVFSVDDTAAWYDALDQRLAGRAADAVRFFRVPGMGHSRGGPATDQYDALTALVDWVERGAAPDRIVAGARGTGNAGGVNADVPSTWSANRTRPLCPYPMVARYKSGDSELAASFACER
ncbi:tannase/feruloyl esterase family alpha/beta hydrolase [Sphaerotilus sp.]|uniref:tannase/feruloyl esterase family alpha/beta hydrolase n=1 Tax=Sphaerotilus sp. TaxID=2093942 RepID=UPI002ACE34B0|nr:tannase/feruloyl esterase family alpha/beta hydrolase [Sphaerotilus sp.]MDZ7856993.1 tannase/feruloyl esterase family alpha/beta hydrolase [Sphaerotilus sp.]